MSEWIEKTIGELCDLGNGKVQTGPFGSQLHQSDYQAEGYPFVMPKDILNGKIDESSIARVSINHVERLSKHKLSLGDIIYGRRGNIGRQALVRQENVGWLCGSGCLRISLGSAPIDSKFLHLYLKLPEVMAWVENQAVGATMPNLNTKILRSVPIRYPKNIDYQQRIVAIVSAYDDLIENNDRRIALLEKMAEEIYREWFIRLRFPGCEKVTFYKGIPEGWEIKQVKDVCTIARGSSPRPINDSRYFLNGTIPWIKIADATASKMFLYETKEYVNDFGSSFSRKLPKGSLIIATSGTLGFSIFLGVEGCVHDGWIYLTKHQNNVKPSFLYYVINCYKEHLNNLSYGAAIQNINTEIIRRLPLMLPSENVLKSFYSVIEPIHRKIDTLGRGNRNLKQTRDRLLTRLISGKLSVEDLDIQLPPSMTANP